ncbi:hypothetical protein SAMN06265795_11975 [Noviherbaspirillum humi]|uniref:Uncharacterized protein n=1 Tax=Noviherbaspirillum humi TaxID=1688639 RepID=A0A239L887_9BURK|nr:hypothetical protein [Noviherbaspirillum humi]SNT25744.1 hypothetical protein SAMN06265795_11975 [Noviherbaspirillum humi]
MILDTAKDVLRRLAHEVAVDIDESELGATAHEEANLTETPHLGAIIVSDAEAPNGDSLRVHAFIELYDNEDNQYEAEIEGEFERLADGRDQWRKKMIRVLDAGPLPKGG